MADLGNIANKLQPGSSACRYVIETDFTNFETGMTGVSLSDVRPLWTPTKYVAALPYHWAVALDTIPAAQRVRPQGNFTTQIDGINDARPVHVFLRNRPLTHMAVDQPTEFTLLPPESVEFVVFGEGVKRSEVWGPYTLAQERMSLTGTMPNGQVSVPYSSSLTAAGLGGIPAWSQGGTFPPGLSHTDGTVSGTPTLAGTYTFSIGVRDGWNQAILYRDFTVTIAP